MWRAHPFVVFVGLALVAGGCGLIGGEQDGYPIQTDRLRYEVTAVEDGRYSCVETSIPMEFKNLTGDVVYFVGCRLPPRPILQRREDDGWVTVWASAEQLCLSPPWAIPPGGTLRDTLRVSGYPPGRNLAPEFFGDVPGRYRLIRVVHKGSDPLSPLLEEKWRVSNEFELDWADE